MFVLTRVNDLLTSVKVDAVNLVLVLPEKHDEEENLIKQSFLTA